MPAAIACSVYLLCKCSIIGSTVGATPSQPRFMYSSYGNTLSESLYDSPVLWSGSLSCLCRLAEIALTALGMELLYTQFVTSFDDPDSLELLHWYVPLVRSFQSPNIDTLLRGFGVSSHHLPLGRHSAHDSHGKVTIYVMVCVIVRTSLISANLTTCAEHHHCAMSRVTVPIQCHTRLE